MLIRYNSYKDKVEFITRNKYIITDTVEDVGAKCLPINLQDTFRKGARILYNSFSNSSNCHSCCIDNNSEFIISNNILYNNLYNNCGSLTPVVTEEEIISKLKDKATGELVDLHFFPVKYKPNVVTSEEDYLRNNLKLSLFVMVQMEQSLQWLISFNRNTQFIIEYRDIELTLNKVANNLSSNSLIKRKIVKEILDYYMNVFDVNFFSSHYKDFMWNVEMFIGKERYINYLTGYDKFRRNEVVGVYLYGDNKLCNWRSITHKLDSSINLFVSPHERMMLKRIQVSMKGKHNQFKEFLKEVIGEWFDINKHWNKLREYIRRVDDSKLDNRISVEACKLGLKQYFKELGETCYDIKLINNNKPRENE